MDTIEKVAEVYAEAYRELALQKIAEVYSIESFPPGYDEALLKEAGFEEMDKEALIGSALSGLGRAATLGTGLLARGASKIAPKASGKLMNVANAMNKNQKLTGGLIAGGAGLAATGAVAGRLSKRRNNVAVNNNG
jgi:hypothetical protein